jgi:hypothetical protein
VAADTISPAASLATGLPSLALEEEDVVVVTPVDMLPVAPSTIGALLAAAAEQGVDVATPRYRGRGGHPVVLRAPLVRVFLDGYRGYLARSRPGRARTSARGGRGRHGHPRRSRHAGESRSRKCAHAHDTRMSTS